MSAPRRTWSAPLLAAALAACTVFAFAGALDNGSLRLDDPTYVFDNEVVKRGLSLEGWRYAWTSGAAANWHPLTWLSHMLDVELFGLDAGKHHAVSVLLHVANAVLAFTLFLRWCGRPWAAFFAAGLFALHPLRVESVAWIAERKDVLSAAFFFAALHAWTSWARSGKRVAFAAALVAFTLGLLAKPMLVTLPFLLLVLDVWPLARRERGLRALVVEKLPFFALAVASSVATFVAQHNWGAVATLDALPAGERVANALVSYVRYLGATAWPAELAIYYPHANATGLANAAGALLLLAAVTAWTWGRRARSPWLLVGWLWYLGLAVPVIGLVQVGQQSHADRYTYLPLLGLVLALVVELDVRSAALAGARRALAVAGVVLLGVCAVLTRGQVALWKDSRTVFAHAIAVTGDNAMARQNLGNALLAEGDLDGAILNLSECVRLSPAFPDAQNNLGSALGAKGRFAEAIGCFEAAIANGQETSGVRANLGWARLQTGDVAGAERDCRRGVELDPDDSKAHERLGTVLAATGRTDEALPELERAVALAPASVEHRRALALALFVAERDAQSASKYADVLALAKDDVESLKNLAWLRATSFDAAVLDPKRGLELAERAARLALPTDARLFDVLGAARAAAGDFPGALAAASRAVELYRAQNRGAKAADVEARLELYRARRPFVRGVPAPR
ncbi:MAG: tetratricopeptide repeat protein [Planctomycetes bacterium]|nr:tetratricopeptide repeat protein [Planctomycetota bacterium]